VTGTSFDPVAVEQQLITSGRLPQAPPGDRPAGEPDSDDRSFTEKYPRLYALWRLSMARQFHPDVLADMADRDLLFLAGQSSEGYPKDGMGGIALEGNKIDGNAIRARVELERRGSALAFQRALRTAILAAVLSSMLAAVFTFLITQFSDDEPPEVTVMVTVPEQRTTTTTAAPTTTTTTATPTTTTTTL
jgi:hypothetical protein